MKIYLFLFALAFGLIVNAQKKSEFGLFGGASYYMGDLNSTIPFSAPSPAASFLLRVNINPRYTIRANTTYAWLKGYIRNSSYNETYMLRNNINDFSTQLLDVVILFELNFLPYNFHDYKKAFSPYANIGAGYSLIMTGVGNNFILPFGVGMKYTLNKRTSVGIDLSFRKIFNDNLDNVVNPGSKEMFFHNNDWYTFAGAFVTYRLFYSSDDCPTYW